MSTGFVREHYYPPRRPQPSMFSYSPTFPSSRTLFSKAPSRRKIRRYIIHTTFGAHDQISVSSARKKKSSMHLLIEAVTFNGTNLSRRIFSKERLKDDYEIGNIIILYSYIIALYVYYYQIALCRILFDIIQGFKILLFKILDFCFPFFLLFFIFLFQYLCELSIALFIYPPERFH